MIPLQNGLRIKIPTLNETEAGYYKCSLATPQGSENVIYTIRMSSANHTHFPLYLVPIIVMLCLMI